MGISEAEFHAMQARLAMATGAQPSPTRRDQAEAVLQDQIVADCRKRGWKVFFSAMHVRTYRPRGEPDLEIFADGGRVFLVECKVGSNKLSPEQMATKAHLEKLGHNYFVVRSFGGFLEIVTPKPKEKEQK